MLCHYPECHYYAEGDVLFIVMLSVAAPNTQHNDTQRKDTHFAMLSVNYAVWLKSALFAERCYAERHYAVKAPVEQPTVHKSCRRP